MRQNTRGKRGMSERNRFRSQCRREHAGEFKEESSKHGRNLDNDCSGQRCPTNYAVADDGASQDHHEPASMLVFA